MKILALNPFHGGSHKAFLDGWIDRSVHQFEVLHLPARKWKWRMRHAPVEFQRLLQDRDPREFDGIFTTDMLDLPTFRGLVPSFAQLPTVVYFHENQLMYPSRSDGHQRERDLHFAFTNLLSGSIADAVWFNSDWHRTTYIKTCRDWLSRMPDFAPLELIDRVEERSSTQYPGVAAIGVKRNQPSDCLRIAWVSRWEHDKNPETFFEALKRIKKQGVRFELNVLGERYRDCPSCFDAAKATLADEIRHWGFAEDRAEYERILQGADVVVSTALHEFFGLAVVEAVSAGCFPVVPNALAYPEVLQRIGNFHRNTASDLARCLTEISLSHSVDRHSLAVGVSRYSWENVAKSLDENILLTFGNR